MESLYTILGISNVADQKEIKKAYVRMLRKHPPEKDPEEFKKIREAYERLIDPISRAEYDAFSQYKEQIEEHQKEADIALENKDFKRAIREYKKILIIEPSLVFAKNRLGLALHYDKQYDAALAQFKEVIEINPNNSTYHSNLAYTYSEVGNFDKAEEEWLIAHKLDSINDDIIIELSELYINKEEYNKAINFLRGCIGINTENNFQDFIYYFQIIKVYIFKNSIENIEKTIDEIERIIPDDNEAKQYVAWKFTNLAYELLGVKLYDIADKLSKRAIEIDNSNEDITKLYNTVKEIKESLQLLEKLLEDKSIVSPIKGPIYYYLRADEYEKDELEKNLNENFNAIQSYLDYEWKLVLDSIDKLKTHYKSLYDYRKDIYSNLYQMALDSMKRNTEWENIKKDKRINNSVIRLLSLWLSNNLTDKERDKYFDNIVNEMDKENSSQLLSSINRVKVNYPELYKLNPDFLEELVTILKKGTRTQSNNNNSNVINKGNNDSNNNNEFKNSYLNSQEPGCAPIIIGAIIGGCLIPGIGIFIGGYIGYKIFS